MVWLGDNSAPVGDLMASLQASTATARFSMAAARLVACTGAITVGLAEVTYTDIEYVHAVEHYLNWSSVTPLPIALVELTPPVSILSMLST